MQGSLADRRKLRLCSDCFTAYVHDLQAVLRDVEDFPDDTEPALTICSRCSATTADNPIQIFVTLYERGQERRDLWGSLCESSSCRDAMYEMLGLVDREQAHREGPYTGSSRARGSGRGTGP